ncbi:hypothetical protein EYC84_000930 [Monilinia fructicola]|uniref:Uncharacterized protein n=1 Tax=Monilinia fructicola TaxID=38448 RepID=A0A5M9JMQ7_MONFR|nr:hypothetical protein EYC84_000930 [Monilinia fructicola]
MPDYSLLCSTPYTKALQHGFLTKIYLGYRLDLHGLAWSHLAASISRSEYTYIRGNERGRALDRNIKTRFG